MLIKSYETSTRSNLANFQVHPVELKLQESKKLLEMLKVLLFLLFPPPSPPLLLSSCVYTGIIEDV